MAKVVLHIGTHKTATTTIQDTFWENSELLARHGLIYPRLSSVTGHHGLVKDWSKLQPVYQLEGGSRAALGRLAEQYGAADGTVFLSSEEFSRAEPTSVDFAEIREILSPFDEIEIMCTLRTQWQFLQSIYLEVSRRANPPRPPEIVRTAVQRGIFLGLWIDYSMLLGHLRQSFHPEEITLVDFDTAKAREGGIVDYYLDHLGIDPGEVVLDKVNDGSSNVSPQSLPAWAANLIAEPARPTKWLMDVTHKAFTAEYGAEARPCLFSRKEYAELDARFAPANAQLAESVAPVQPGFTLSGTADPEKMIYRENINHNFWMRSNRQMFKAVIDGEKAHKQKAAAAGG